MPSLKRPKSSLAQMALSSKQYALKGQRLEKILGQKSSSKSARMTKLWQFCQGHPKPALCKKVQRGDQKKFFKNRLESCPRLKGPTALQRKRHYTLISIQLQGKDWRRFWGKKVAPKVPEWPSYGTFCKVTQNPHFLKKSKGGPREIFQKSPKQQPSFERLKSTLAQITLSSIYYALTVQRQEKIWAQKADPNVPEWLSYANFRTVTQNPHLLKKCKGGGQRKFFKNRPKSCPRLKGPKALWRKWHYPLFSMHLQCKDWKRFWRKRRLQKCPNDQVMAILKGSPKTRIF